MAVGENTSQFLNLNVLSLNLKAWKALKTIPAPYPKHASGISWSGSCFNSKLMSCSTETTQHTKKVNGRIILLYTGMKDDDENNWHHNAKRPTAFRSHPLGVRLVVCRLVCTSGCRANHLNWLRFFRQFVRHFVFWRGSAHVSVGTKREGGKAGRKRETILVVTFLNSWSWKSKKQDIFPYKCIEKEEEEGLELTMSIDW